MWSIKLVRYSARAARHEARCPRHDQDIRDGSDINIASDINRTLINLRPSDGRIAGEILIGRDRDRPDICYYHHSHTPRHLSARDHREAGHHGPWPRRGRSRGHGGHLPLRNGRGGGGAGWGGGVEHREVRGEGGHLVPDGGGQGGRGLGLRGGRGLRAQREHGDRGEMVQRDPHLDKKLRIQTGNVHRWDEIGVLNKITAMNASIEKKIFWARFENWI